MKRLQPLTVKNERAELIRSRALAPAGAEREEAERILSKWRGKLREKTHGWKPFPWKAFSVRNLLIAGCAVLILLAAYLNLRFAEPGVLSEGEPTEVLDASAEQSAAEDDYFAIAVINRQRARDEAIDMYQTVADDTAATESSRSAAYASMNELVDRSAVEIDVENQIKAKGFANCVAIVDNDRANVIVETDGLSQSEVAQITEIVYLKTGIPPQNLTITEKA